MYRKQQARGTLMNVEEQLITLIKGVSDLTAKIEEVQKSVDDMREMSKTVSVHATRLGQIEESLQRGNKKFDKIEDRLTILEKAEGEKAKTRIQTVGQYMLTALVGAIIANIPTIINTLGGGR